MNIGSMLDGISSQIMLGCKDIHIESVLGFFFLNIRMIKNRIGHQVLGMAKSMVLARMVDSKCGIRESKSLADSFPEAVLIKSWL